MVDFINYVTSKSKDKVEVISYTFSVIITMFIIIAGTGVGFVVAVILLTLLLFMIPFVIIYDIIRTIGKVFR